MLELKIYFGDIKGKEKNLMKNKNKLKKYFNNCVFECNL